MKNLITTFNHQAVTSSRTIAENFDKKHKDVLEAIRNLAPEMSTAEFSALFYETEYIAANGKRNPEYLINKKGFQLLAMGFTGSKAIHWKLKYIDAFEAMEKSLATPQLTPAPRYRARHLSTALIDMQQTKEALQKMFKVNDGIAYSKAISMIEQLYGVSFDSLRELLPAAEHSTGYLTPTEIGKRIGRTAKEVNLLLAGYGLQHKEGKEWRLDEAGHEYGEEVPYTAHTGHSGYQIRWNEKVIPALEADIRKAGDAK